MRVGIKWEKVRMIKFGVLIATLVGRRHVWYWGSVLRFCNYHNYFSFSFIMLIVCPAVK